MPRNDRLSPDLNSRKKSTLKDLLSYKHDIPQLQIKKEPELKFDDIFKKNHLYKSHCSNSRKLIEWERAKS